MTNSKKPLCDRWVENLESGIEGTISSSFSRHLADCDTCRKEWSDLRTVWEALAINTDEFEVPEGLKEEVMSAISEGKPSAKVSVRRKTRWNHAVLITIACACIFFLGIWGGKLSDRNSNLADVPFQPQKEWKLVSYTTNMSRAAGTVTLMLQGRDRKIIVVANDLLPTVKDQAYQVWMNYDGKQFNCGTFRVDAQGNGLIVYDITDPDLSIDSVRITLEPDSRGNSPRGQTVIGTPESNS